MAKKAKKVVLPIHRDQLSFDQRTDIMDAWSKIGSMLLEGKDDPTSPFPRRRYRKRKSK